ncbi:hypothetical protein PVAP13_9KG518326, partial [Panicum virgatum]
MHWPGAWRKFGKAATGHASGLTDPSASWSWHSTPSIQLWLRPCDVVRDLRCSAACCHGYVSLPSRDARRGARSGCACASSYCASTCNPPPPRVPRLRPWPWPTHGKDAPDMFCQLAADQARDSTRVPNSASSKPH